MTALNYTHEQRISQINKWIKEWRKARKSAAKINNDGDQIVDMDIVIASLIANRNTLEKHKVGINEAENHCRACLDEFPCPTYLSVAIPLEEVME